MAAERSQEEKHPAAGVEVAGPLPAHSVEAEGPPLAQVARGWGVVESRDQEGSGSGLVAAAVAQSPLVSVARRTRLGLH